MDGDEEMKHHHGPHCQRRISEVGWTQENLAGFSTKGKYQLRKRY